MEENTVNPEKTEPVGENPTPTIPIVSEIPSNAFLIMEGTHAIPLKQELITIGRGHDNVIVLDDPRVSRKHLEIRVIREHFVLFDLNSSGGTYVNGQRVSQGILYAGDVLSLAGVTLVFMQDSRLRAPGSDAMTSMGPGERNTAIFNPSTDKGKKARGWW